MSRSTWATAVVASVFAFALTPAAALAASPSSAAARPASAPAKPGSDAVPIVHHIVAVKPPPLAHPKRASAAQRPVAEHPVLVLLALGSGYQQADGSGLVRTLQRGLARVGDTPGPIDGRYGPLTTNAVIRFQTAQGLRVDGIAGRQTLTRLRVVLARSPRPAHAHPSPTPARPVHAHPSPTPAGPVHASPTPTPTPTPAPVPQHPAVTTTHPRPVATHPASSDWNVLWFVLAGLAAAAGVTVLVAVLLPHRPRVRPRRRRHISRRTLPIARLAGFRYCKQRDAYVLRLVGDRFGPVLKTPPANHHQPPPRHRSPALRADARRRLDQQAPLPEAREKAGDRR